MARWSMDFGSPATECWQCDRSFEAVACNGLRAFIEAYGTEDGLDQYDWAVEERCPHLCSGPRGLVQK